MVDKTKIAKYIADIERQLDDLSKLQVSDADVFNRQEKGEERVIPESFAKQIVGMVNFRNKLAHEYLPDEFEAERLFENLQRTEDFRIFSRHIIEFLTRFEQNNIS